MQVQSRCYSVKVQLLTLYLLMRPLLPQNRSQQLRRPRNPLLEQIDNLPLILWVLITTDPYHFIPRTRSIQSITSLETALKDRNSGLDSQPIDELNFDVQ